MQPNTHRLRFRTCTSCAHVRSCCKHGPLHQNQRFLQPRPSRSRMRSSSSPSMRCGGHRDFFSRARATWDSQLQSFEEKQHGQRRPLPCARSLFWHRHCRRQAVTVGSCPVVRCSLCFPPAREDRADPCLVRRALCARPPPLHVGENEMRMRRLHAGIGSTAHNLESARAQPPAKRQRCKVCQQPGHNARSCGRRRAA